MPIAVPTRGTAAAERCNAHRDLILSLLRYSGNRLTVTQVADAIDATIDEAGQALELLRRAYLVDVEHTPYQPRTFSVTATGLQP